MLVGITERGDAALSDDWAEWVYNEENPNPAILITKNAPLLEMRHPDILSKNVIIHATCTGLGGTCLEPNVPDCDIILDWVKNQPASLQRKIVLRCDPICPPLWLYQQYNFDGKKYFNNVQKILNTAKDYNIRCRISFLDMYNHVKNRFKDIDLAIPKEYENNDIHLSLSYRKSILEIFNSQGFNVEICGEPGLACSGCVSTLDVSIFGYRLTGVDMAQQRKACACLGLKHELLNNKHPCKHNCIYCYWKD